MNDQLNEHEKVDIALLRAEHQKRFQMMIDFIKERVGEGAEYSNPAARMVVSERGAYCELTDLPEEFCGAAGKSIHLSFVREQDAVNLLERAAAAYGAAAATDTRQLQILAIYSRRGLVDRENCYVVNYMDRLEGAPSHEPIGSLRPGAMPLFYKIKVDTCDSGISQSLGIGRGIYLCIITSGDRYPLLRIHYDAGTTTDLTIRKLSRAIQ